MQKQSGAPRSNGLCVSPQSKRLLYEILPQEGGRNAPLPIESIPECLKTATIAVEDRNFYQNPGVELEGIVRAHKETYQVPTRVLEFAI